jgi:hypothetical protein
MVLAAVKASPDPLAARDIRGRVDGETRETLKALHHLKASGFLTAETGADGALRYTATDKPVPPHQKRGRPSKQRHKPNGAAGDPFVEGLTALESALKAQVTDPHLWELIRAFVAFSIAASSR